MTRHPEEGALHAYIDGELSPAETAALELHVGECALCAAALAEARGFVAAASRVITTLDAAPSSAAKAPVPVAGVPTAPSKRVMRPPIFRVPYARAAALLLLVGGTAFVVDRTGTFARGESARTESVAADAAAGSDLAATAPEEAATTTATTPTGAPEVATAAVSAARSIGVGSGGTGTVRRERVAPRGVVAGVTTDGTTGALSAERSVPAPETATAEFAGRGVAGGTAKPTAFPTAPPPARMDMRSQERAAMGALNPSSTVVRYRTRDGIIVTLTEEPLRTTFTEESVAKQQSAPQPMQRTAAAPMAAMSINSYRWSNAERGRIYTLSGPLTVAELEALSKRLNELERLP